jgi:hypothetical protein
MLTLDFIDAAIDAQRLLNAWHVEHGIGTQAVSFGRWRASSEDDVYYDMGGSSRFDHGSVLLDTLSCGPLLVHVQDFPGDTLDTYTFHLSNDPESLRIRLFLAFEEASGVTP